MKHKEPLYLKSSLLILKHHQPVWKLDPVARRFIAHISNTFTLLEEIFAISVITEMTLYYQLLKHYFLCNQSKNTKIQLYQNSSKLVRLTDL